MATQADAANLAGSHLPAHGGHFFRHAAEMTAAMPVGMAAAVPVLWAIFAALGVGSADEASADYPELVCLVVGGGIYCLAMAPAMLAAMLVLRGASGGHPNTTLIHA